MRTLEAAIEIRATPEAIFVAMLDNLDAKTQMALTAARPEEPSPIEGASVFTDKHWALDNARIYKPDPLKE